MQFKLTGDNMKFSPIRQVVINHYDDEELALDQVFECCDSYIAVLTQDQIDEWLSMFNYISDPEITDFSSSTLVFDIDNKLLTIVSDSGGESASGVFQTFCEQRNIPCQFVIDTIDCTGVGIEEIYTGVCDNNMELLELLHKVYN
jgi:hypothetical protein